MYSNFISQDALEKAILFQLFAYSQKENEEIEAEHLLGFFNADISQKRIEMGLAELENRKLIATSYGDSYDPTTHTIARRGYMVIEEELKDPASFASQYLIHRDEFLNRQTVGGIPAADRYVSRQDNAELINSLEDGMRTLATNIEESNSIEEEIGDPKEAVICEINASQELMKSEKFSLRKLFDLLVPLLRKLADKFASGAIGKLAGELIEVILKL